MVFASTFETLIRDHPHPLIALKPELGFLCRKIHLLRPQSLQLRYAGVSSMGQILCLFSSILFLVSLLQHFLSFVSVFPLYFCLKLSLFADCVSVLVIILKNSVTLRKLLLGCQTGRKNLELPKLEDNRVGSFWMLVVTPYTRLLA